MKRDESLVIYKYTVAEIEICLIETMENDKQGHRIELAENVNEIQYCCLTFI